MATNQKGREDDNNESLSVSARIPNRLILALLAAVGFGGVSLGTVLPVGVDKLATRQCFDAAEQALTVANTATGIAERAAEQATIALGVAGDHGTELKHLDARIEGVRNSIFDRTSDRFTGEDAEKHQRSNDRQFDKLDTRVERLEEITRTLQGWHGVGK